MHTLKITSIGNSLGIIIPKELLAKMRLGKGDQVFATELPGGGVTLRPHDPEFVRQMELAEYVMRKDRDVLKRLAE